MGGKQVRAVRALKQVRHRIDDWKVNRYAALKRIDLPPIHPITASAFTAELHKLARKTNGSLKILDNCPSDMVELPDYFASLKPIEVACGFKVCIANALADELDSRGLLGRSESKGIIANVIRALAIAQDKLIETGCDLYWAKPPSEDKSDRATHTVIVRDGQHYLVSQLNRTAIETPISHTVATTYGQLKKAKLEAAKMLRRGLPKKGAA